ncbi:phosphoglycerate dehydrogenase [Fructilactobacillus florum]|uniref:phosphoglycerate dehydrogenase n=1 Tax=Fructilactobacillus florum TaxID=640331 RepID=UPI00028DF3C1|nr:phosphoglycerate dehydrogenase [Fructilactobacillus florum]EKK21206.1 D-3-phosphoglycerate dehydrogenase [Fructilactobacillus florum 2F]
MKPVIAIPKSLPATARQLLVDHATLVELTESTATALTEQAPQAVAAIWGLNPLTTADLESLPKLRLIARMGVGYDNLDVEALRQRGVAVTITPHANANTVAEATVAEIFDLMRHLTRNSMLMRQGDWLQAVPGSDLAGKTAGILGYGRIGKLVAQKLAALGMKILISTPHPATSTVGKFVDREQLFRTADVVTLHLPANPTTIGSIGSQELSWMKASSVLVNLARGPIVNQSALLTALQQQKIAGAALDVFTEQPLPLTSPLYQLPNVLLTPHLGGSTTEAIERMSVDAASEILRLLQQQPLRWSL